MGQARIRLSADVRETSVPLASSAKGRCGVSCSLFEDPVAAARRDAIEARGVRCVMRLRLSFV